LILNRLSNTRRAIRYCEWQMENFYLHLSSSYRPVDDEWLIRIDLGAALIWINAAPDQAAGRFSLQRRGTRGGRVGGMLLGRAAPCSLDVLRAQPHDTVSAFTGSVN
jgi:hypothetical protein